MIRIGDVDGDHYVTSAVEGDFSFALFIMYSPIVCMLTAY
jgi:hypothetical protein